MLELIKGQPIVDTKSGPVIGLVDPSSRQYRFLGIPYAEPPLGALRFRPPQPRMPWSTPRDCTKFGPAGAQIFDPSEGAYSEFTDEPAPDGPAQWVGSEDCLTLNVWRRENGANKKPVLVWIHGGANCLESSRLDIYHGDSFVERQDVIFISINYRLGFFGWLDLSGIGGPTYRGSHSNGLRDQILALRWIHANIAAFGGDPENITVMGESAGSIDISWHLAAGQLHGIARRVVMMSGVTGLPGMTGPLPDEWSEAHGIRLADKFLHRMNVRSMAELQSMSTAAIMERVVRVASFADTLFDIDSLFWPRKSDTYAPIDPFTAARAGKMTGIDVLIGCTDYEMGLWLNWDDELDQRPVQSTIDRLLLFSPAQSAEMAARYAAWFAQDRPGSLGMHLLGDILFRLPTIWFADELAGQGGNVWTYLFDWSVDDRRRALHAADQCFLFKKWDTEAGRQLLGPTLSAADTLRRDKAAASMQDAILAFAIAGNPNLHQNPYLSDWAAYDTDTRATMRFGRETALDQDPAADRRRWWTKNIYQPLWMK